MNIERDKPDHRVLSDFIDGKLPREIHLMIESELKSNSVWFSAYMELKEVRFLESLGHKPTPEEQAKLMKIVQPQRGHYFVVIVKLIGDRIMLMNGDQSKLEFQAVSAEFAVRGENFAGPVSFSRTIDSREITVTMTPDRDRKKFSLAVSLKKPEALRANLLADGSLLERLPDLSKASEFTSDLTTPGKYDLVLYEGENELCRIDLRFQVG